MKILFRFLLLSALFALSLGIPTQTSNNLANTGPNEPSRCFLCHYELSSFDSKVASLKNDTKLFKCNHKDFHHECILSNVATSPDGACPICHEALNVQNADITDMRKNVKYLSEKSAHRNMMAYIYSGDLELVQRVLLSHPGLRKHSLEYLKLCQRFEKYSIMRFLLGHPRNIDDSNYKFFFLLFMKYSSESDVMNELFQAEGVAPKYLVKFFRDMLGEKVNKYWAEKGLRYIISRPESFDPVEIMDLVFASENEPLFQLGLEMDMPDDLIASLWQKCAAKQRFVSLLAIQTRLSSLGKELPIGHDEFMNLASKVVRQIPLNLLGAFLRFKNMTDKVFLDLYASAVDLKDEERLARIEDAFNSKFPDKLKDLIKLKHRLAEQAKLPWLKRVMTCSNCETEGYK